MLLPNIFRTASSYVTMLQVHLEHCRVPQDLMKQIALASGTDPLLFRKPYTHEGRSETGLSARPAMIIASQNIVIDDI